MIASAMYVSAPPAAWADLGAPSRPSPQALARAAGAGDVERVATSWKHVRNVVAHDARTPDLFELLSHSVRETQYSFQPQGVSNGAMTNAEQAMLLGWQGAGGGGNEGGGVTTHQLLLGPPGLAAAVAAVGQGR